MAPWQHITPILVALADLDHEEAIEALAETQRMLKRRRRGGDPQAERRRQRDEDIRALARITGKDRPLSQIARELLKRCERYQPMTEERTPERLLLQRISNTGLPLPGVRQMVNILSE